MPTINGTNLGSAAIRDASAFATPASVAAVGLPATTAAQALGTGDGPQFQSVVFGGNGFVIEQDGDRGVNFTDGWGVPLANINSDNSFWDFKATNLNNVASLSAADVLASNTLQCAGSIQARGITDNIFSAYPGIELFFNQGSGEGGVASYDQPNNVFYRLAFYASEYNFDIPALNVSPLRLFADGHTEIDNGAITTDGSGGMSFANTLMEIDDAGGVHFAQLATADLPDPTLNAGVTYYNTDTMVLTTSNGTAWV